MKPADSLEAIRKDIERALADVKGSMVFIEWIEDGDTAGGNYKKSAAAGVLLKLLERRASGSKISRVYVDNDRIAL